MIALLYLGLLMFALTCMMLIDRRWQLCFWHRPRRSAVVLAAGLVFFLAWDVVGISTGLFLRGDSPAMTGIDIAPHLPIEELVFLTFLCYLTLNLVRGIPLLLRRRPGRGSAS